MEVEIPGTKEGFADAELRIPAQMRGFASRRARHRMSLYFRIPERSFGW
jgi:hypothetical protein